MWFIRFKQDLHPVCLNFFVCTCGKHLHDRIIWLRNEVWSQKTSLTPTLYLSACTRQDIEQSWIYVVVMSDLPIVISSITGVWILHFTTHNIILYLVPSTVIFWTELRYWHKSYSNRDTLLLGWSHRFKNSI